MTQAAARALPQAAGSASLTQSVTQADRDRRRAATVTVPVRTCRPRRRPPCQGHRAGRTVTYCDRDGLPAQARRNLPVLVNLNFLKFRVSTVTAGP